MKLVIHSSVGGRSHARAMLEVGQVLVERGHSVVFAALDENLRFGDGYNMSRVSLGSLQFSDMRTKLQELMADNTNLMGRMMDMLGPILARFYAAEYASLWRVLEDKVDLVVCDIAANACLDIAKAQGIPLVIGLQTTDSFRMNAVPFVTRIAGYGPLTTENLGLAERMWYSVLEPLVNLPSFYRMMRPVNELRARQGFKPRLRIFDFEYGIALANTYFGFETAVPTEPSLHLVGPIFPLNPQPLTPELEAFLVNSPRTLYICFGSQILLDAKDTRTIFAAIQSALDSNTIDAAIWANFDQAQLPPPNINRLLTIGYAPQQAILAHPNTRAFISHGGLESSLEAIHSGTPILCMPFISDQPRNAAKIERARIGIYVDRATVTPASLHAGIQQIIANATAPSDLIVNLHRMQQVSHANANRRHHAADLIESHYAIAKACRPQTPFIPTTNQPPCEMHHLVPVSSQMSFIRANALDMYGLIALMGLLLLCLLKTSLSLLFNAIIPKTSLSPKKTQ
ncbi:hypothetical protein DSO57_1021684 [Entomophthora muscae]|uniref:Uncharacterized protein n=1 Tax=Entomophthora muscae TaxID=34485 RepID=A0ACC2U1X4_9FUNG|nr:hypothetical protein DSO57_1021684 [Entomophthora muscae]